MVKDASCCVCISRYFHIKSLRICFTRCWCEGTLMQFSFGCLTGVGGRDHSYLTGALDWVHGAPRCRIWGCFCPWRRDATRLAGSTRPERRSLPRDGADVSAWAPASEDINHSSQYSFFYGGVCLDNKFYNASGMSMYCLYVPNAQNDYDTTTQGISRGYLILYTGDRLDLHSIGLKPLYCLEILNSFIIDKKELNQ